MTTRAGCEVPSATWRRPVCNIHECDKEVSHYLREAKNLHGVCCDCAYDLGLIDSPYEWVHKRGKDLKRQSFGRLVALEVTEKREDNCRVWICQCDCGETTEVPADRLISGGTRSCGCLRREVASERSRNLTGPDHPSWVENPATEEEQYWLDRERSFRNWRPKVLDRDNRTCLRCSAGYDLEAHHVLSFAEWEDLRLAVGNGATLCEECHRGFHSEYGQAGFGVLDLYEFIGWTTGAPSARS